jgi:Fur family peroxide stress response transcriptional regulator
MDPDTKRRRLQSFEQHCRARGVPATVQRRAILEAVLDLKMHPTADQVLDAVARRIPGVSRTTVYRTLDALVAMGLITKVAHIGGAVRYDPNTSVHHHLVCQSCDAVIDIYDERLDHLPIPDTSLVGFEVIDYRVQLRGICRSCKAKEDEP